MWRMKNKRLINEFSAPILSRTMKWNIILRQTTSSINSDLSMSYHFIFFISSYGNCVNVRKRETGFYMSLYPTRNKFDESVELKF